MRMVTLDDFVEYTKGIFQQPQYESVFNRIATNKARVELIRVLNLSQDSKGSKGIVSLHT